MRHRIREEKANRVVYVIDNGQDRASPWNRQRWHIEQNKPNATWWKFHFDPGPTRTIHLESSVKDAVARQMPCPNLRSLVELLKSLRCSAPPPKKNVKNERVDAVAHGSPYGKCLFLPASGITTPLCLQVVLRFLSWCGHVCDVELETVPVKSHCVRVGGGGGGGNFNRSNWQKMS